MRNLMYLALIVFFLVAAFAVYTVVSGANKVNEVVLAPVGELVQDLFVAATPVILPDPITIVNEVNDLARLETVSMSFDKIITAERNTDLLWGALGETLIFVANGTVVAGVDLAQMQPTDIVVVDPDTVMVYLPPAEVFDLPVLDNDRSYVANRDTGLFASTDPQLETQVRQAAEAEIIAAAYEAQIVATAQTNAEAYMTTFMNNLGFTEIIFTDAPPPPAPPYVPVVPKGYVVVTVTPSH